jgi:hypothetical protein
MQMKQPDWMTESDRAAFTLLLEIWREFMAGGDHTGGYRSRDSTVQSEAAPDFEQLCDRADYVTYQAVDACIDGLALPERCAIYATNGQARVMRFPRLDPVKTLFEAEQNLLAKLKRNHCTAIKF